MRCYTRIVLSYISLSLFAVSAIADPPSDSETITHAPKIQRPKLDYVIIKGGPFVRTMSSEQKTITVPDFMLSRAEVTVAQYRACVEAGVCTQPEAKLLCNWGKSNGRSVIGVVFPVLNFTS